MTFEDLKKLQLGDEVWLIEIKPLFEKDGGGAPAGENPLISAYTTWSDGYVNRKTLLDGHGPMICKSSKFYFGGCWKSSSSWKTIYVFCRGKHDIFSTDVFFIYESWPNDICGKNGVMAPDLSAILDRKRCYKVEDVFATFEECEAECAQRNKKLNTAALAKGLRKMIKVVKELEKTLT